ncbi:MAG: phosphoribosyl-ATP diphosphatase [Oscillospiraceae bacterium]|jgi:phosphoribosyl-ATP pyrophosphohydrolase|nr:phosphoribosyl-ATP diphosphatase [Oscillospiraceae bacterium]
MNCVLSDLYKLVNGRKNAPEANSYTSYLFEKGLDKILKKCGEECSEMIIAAKNSDENSTEELKNEVADLLYHIIVLCVQSNVTWHEIEEIMSGRSKKIGNLKQFHNAENDLL